MGVRSNVEGKEVKMLIDALEIFHEKMYQKEEYEGHNWIEALNKIINSVINLNLCASQFMTSSAIKLHFISMSLEKCCAWLTLMAAKSQVG